MGRAPAPGIGARVQRRTRQGQAVLAAVRAADAFLSAQEIHARLRAAGAAVGLTTVYRHLQLLEDEGLVDALQQHDGETLYRHCATCGHHHHLVCRGCGHSEEIEGPQVEEWAQQIARRHGFSAVSHTLEIFGLCARCGAGELPLDEVPAGAPEGGGERVLERGGLERDDRDTIG